MPKRIGKIEVAISVEGTGTIVGLAIDEWLTDPKEAVYRRERIQIRTPEGKCLSTFIQSMSTMHSIEHPLLTCFILPGRDVAFDIPKGSELWLERDDGAKPVLEP